MYFDTLKLSSVEQSASSTSAKGGQGNPELITWNFGKEITVNLTDALYTPASLSLLWGGKFGSKNAEINGFWNPIHKEKQQTEEIVNHERNQTDDTIKLLKKFKKQIKEYEKVINQIYNIIQNAEDFLHPNSAIYSVNFPVSNIINLFFTSDLVYDLTQTYVPLHRFQQDKLYLKAAEREGAEVIKPYGYGVNFLLEKLELENNNINRIYPKYYNDIINIYDFYGIKESTSIPYIVTPLKTYTTDELLLQREINLWMLLELFARKIPNKAVEDNAWKILSNKELYSLDVLIGSCKQIFYNYISMTTEYKEPENIIPISILMENFKIENVNNSLKLTFLIDEESININDSYTYTSKYLGQNLEDIFYPYILNINEEPVDYTCSLFLPRVQKIGQPAERAKIILKNFNDFNVYIRKKGITYNSRILLHEIGVNGQINFNNQEEDVFYEYEWKDCEISMVSSEGVGDTYFTNHIDILYRINSSNYQQKVLIKRTNDKSYYNSQIDFFEEKLLDKEKEKIKIGTFYINDSFNNISLSENSFYPIVGGINELFYLDRLEKHKAERTFCIDTDKNFNSNIKKDLPQYKETKIIVYIDPKTMKPFQSNTNSFIRQDGTVVYGNLCTIKKDSTYYLWRRDVADEYKSLGNEIVVTGKDFPGTYKLVANTYTRSRADGKDSRLQIEIPICTILPETNLELTADGEPVTFNMQLKVLKNNLDEMIKIQKFDVVSNENGEIKQKAYFRNPANGCETCDTPKITFTKETDILDMQIVLPQEGDYYCFTIDCQPPFNGTESYLAIPTTNEIATKMYDVYKDYQNLINSEVPTDPEERETYNQKVAILKRQLEEYRNTLLVKVPLADTIIYIGEIPYLIATDGGYEFYTDSEEMTEQINGKIYRIAFITQENIKRFSPIKFTLIGGINS